MREELSLTLGSKIESQMEDFAISIVPTKQIAFLELLRHILKKVFNKTRTSNLSVMLKAERKLATEVCPKNIQCEPCGLKNCCESRNTTVWTKNWKTGLILSDNID